jgi:hypothetical protein
MLGDRRDSWIGLLSFGFFVMLFAMFFLIVPNYGNEVVEFFRDIKLEEVAPNLYLPVPEHSAVIYRTVMWFSLAFGLFQFAILALRFFFRSRLSKIAETMSNIVLWLGAAYMFHLLYTKAVTWFPFIGGIVVVVGLTIIVRSLVTLPFWQRSRTQTAHGF